MNALRLNYNKIDFEKVMITVGMTLMEVSGIVFLFCGLFDIRIF